VTRPWHGEDDAGLSDASAVAVDRLLARTPQEHLRRAAMIATNGANDSSSRLQTIEHLLWVIVKTRPVANSANPTDPATEPE
jgi:hypothetical protein